MCARHSSQHSMNWPFSSTLLKFQGFPILDLVDVELASSYCVSCDYSVKFKVQTYGWYYVSFRYAEYWMNGRLLLNNEGCVTGAVLMLYGSYSNDRYALHSSTYSWSILDVAIIYPGGQQDGFQSWEWDLSYFPIRRGVCKVFGEQILCETLMIVHHSTS